MHENKMTITQTAQELNISREQLSRVLHSDKEVSDRLFNAIEQLFQRNNYTKALDNKGRL